MDIRHIAVSESTPVFAVGAFEHDVTVWDYTQRRKVAELKTILDFGGERLAIYNRELPLLIAGNYNRYGVCAYNLSPPGKVAWWRRDLKKPQMINVSERLGLISSSFDDAELHILDVTSGDSIRKFSRKAFQCYFGPLDDEIILAESFGEVWSASIKTGRVIHRFPVQRNALHIAQSEDYILISNQGDTDDSGETITQIAPSRLLCYSRDARLLWQVDAPPGTGFWRTVWCPELRLWFAVEEPYEHGPKKVKAFTPEGRLAHEAIIGDVSETEFFLQGQCLITSDGEVLELPNLNVLWQFDG